jgi:hypothetical protein
MNINNFTKTLIDTVTSATQTVLNDASSTTFLNPTQNTTNTPGSTITSATTVTTKTSGGNGVAEVFQVFTYNALVPRKLCIYFVFDFCHLTNNDNLLAWEFALRMVVVFFMMLTLGLERQAQRKPLGLNYC